MDMDDDDAFLYGDESPPKPQQVALPPTTTVDTNEMKSEVTVPPPLQAITSTSTSAPIPANGISSSMAASLAAYGMDTSATIVDNPEDGGVEEEEDEDDDDDDDDSDDSDDDIKVVFTGQNARTLDLRKPQTAPSNVIGIGKWAHTSTGTTAPAAATPTPAPGTPQVSTPSRPVQPTANQTTEYTPTSRPGVAQVQAQAQPSTAGPLVNPPISSTPSDPSITVQPPSSSADGISGVPPLNPGQPPSTLPPVSSSQFITKTKIDPSNPTGIIPSTGQSVFEIDMTQFENSGQPWRKPGATLSDYFNFGFDEFTYPRYLRYKNDMEKGRAALANLPPMAQLPPDIANLLHIPNQNIPFNAIAAAQQQQQQQAQQQQQQQQQMQLMANQIQQQMGMMNPQMQAQMQQMMAMQGLDMNMMNMNQGGGGGMPFGMGMQPQQGMGQQQPQQQQQQQQQQQPMIRPGQNGRPPGMTPTSQSGNMGTPEAGEEVKLEEGVERQTRYETPDAQAQGQMMNPAMRGRMPVRGVPVRGVPLRGRGGAVPLGPRAGFAAPTGPKAGRFRDKDKVDTSGAGSLDYGGSEGLGGDSDAVKSETRGDDQGDSNSYSHSRSQSRSHSRAQSRDRSASPPSGRRRSSKRDYHDYDDDYSSEDRDRDRDRDREKRRSSRRSKNEDSNSGSSRSKRKREEGGGSATLGPGGWESEDEEDERRSRRKRSPSEESTEKRTRRSKRR
ncbi:hypothetical protein V865_002088 [Kwoniella europaea PYCC6329]|uniref:Pre-mRNA polyadenylation factor Fip1 domain-containing protein n=1 Tax=Kwoniella europaea PYCC6329 TaxID=1423913 RepID=A0AAX4KCB7_9TREE